MSNSTQNEVLYIAWYCPHEPLGHFVCEKATQKDIDEHLATHTNETHHVCNERLAREGDKATCCECNPHENCMHMRILMKKDQMRSKLLERLDFLSDHWVKGDDRPPFNFGGWREEVADEFIEIYKNYSADARKEVIKRIEAMPDKDVRPQITVWLESKEYCLGYNKALSNVLATLREEEGSEK